MTILRRKHKPKKMKLKHRGGPIGSLDGFCESSGAAACDMSPAPCECGGMCAGM